MAKNASIFFKLFTFLFVSTGSGLAQNSEAHVFVNTIWSDRILNVCWENGEQFAQERVWTQEAVAETWEAQSSLKFAGWARCRNTGNEVRIRVADTGPHTKGLGSHLAGKAQGVVLNFTFNNWGQDCKSNREFCIKALAAHEFGHVLGFAHEQGRDDTPASCTERQNNEPTGGLEFGPWDPNSIMNYCNRRWSNGGRLSDGDIDAVRYFYGPPAGERSNRNGIFFVGNNFLNLHLEDGPSIRLGAPVWTGPTSMTSSGQELFIVQNSVLHRVDPSNGTYTVERDVRLDPSLPIAASEEHLFFFEGGKLKRQSLNDQSVEALGTTDWSSGTGVQAIAEDNGSLYIVQSGQLHLVSGETGNYRKLGDPVWAGDVAMVSDGSRLYVIQNSALHHVDGATGAYRVVGDPVWADATGIAHLSSQLYVMQNGSLHKVNKENGSYQWIRDDYWNASSNLAAVD